eukprot:3156684-Ditylum_brightwellii.AAC.1
MVVEGKPRLINMMAPSAGEQGGSSDSSVRETKQLASFMQRQGDGTGRSGWRKRGPKLFGVTI